MKREEIIYEIKKIDSSLSNEVKSIFDDLKSNNEIIEIEYAGSRSRGLYFDIGKYRKYKSDFDIYLILKIENIEDRSDLERKEILEIYRGMVRGIIEKNSLNYKHFPGMSKIRTQSLGIDFPMVLQDGEFRYVLNNLTGNIQKSNSEFLEKEVSDFVELNLYGTDLLRVIRSFRGLLRIKERKYPKGLILDLLIIKNFTPEKTFELTLISTLKKVVVFLEEMENFELEFKGERVVLNYEKENFILFIEKINLFIQLIE